MLFTRFISFIAAAATIMSVSASPFVARDNGSSIVNVVDPTAALAQSELAAFNSIDLSSYMSKSNLMARTHHKSDSCYSKGCNEKQILHILKHLKIKVFVTLAHMDGKRSPIGPCNNLVNDITLAIKLLGAVQVNAFAYGPACQEIVAIICEIIFGILGCLSKYTVWSVLFLAVKIDVVLAALLNACIALIPGVLALIVAGINPYVSSCTTFGFTLTLKACGLY